jgi:hypothetical protein
VSVTPAAADTTTTTARPLAAARTIPPACRMRSPVPTEVPPNFITIKLIAAGSSVKTKEHYLLIPELRAAKAR